jgi:hypothetical protein
MILYIVSSLTTSRVSMFVKHAPILELYIGFCKPCFVRPAMSMPQELSVKNMAIRSM